MNKLISKNLKRSIVKVKDVEIIILHIVHFMYIYLSNILSILLFMYYTKITSAMLECNYVSYEIKVYE